MGLGLAGAGIGYGYGSGYYDNGGYYGGGYAPAYYGGAVEVQQDVGGSDQDVAYCIQRFRSYDQQSGTYLGNDGQRHRCPQ
ncbi:hypothetical protein ASF32_00690 [Methylobacterium sp. Leaf91]|nr:hypothetical protein ASF24_09265 [Methylobacterium sp. Leaf86]KQP00442.1 hypothetical protein ASF32_00690 [Methylobacterium sp. Leaf91]